MARTVTIIEGDLAIEFTATLKEDGAAVNLTGSTVAFQLRNVDTGEVKVDGSAATVVDPTAGTVKYAPASGDTDTAGKYAQRWIVTTSEGKPLAFPNKGHNTIIIEEGLA